jgi:hypothetical protein
MRLSIQNPVYSHYLERGSIRNFTFLHEVHSFETVSSVSDFILGIHIKLDSSYSIYEYTRAVILLIWNSFEIRLRHAELKVLNKVNELAT